MSEEIKDFCGNVVARISASRPHSAESCVPALVSISHSSGPFWFHLALTPAGAKNLAEWLKIYAASAEAFDAEAAEGRAP